MEAHDRMLLLDCFKELHHFTRSVCSQSRGGVLRNTELELLALIQLSPGSCTPLSLSHQTGMKKEAVSRGLRQLFEQGWLKKVPNPEDERSYMLSLTPEGQGVLDAAYDFMLRPLCVLRQEMGAEFGELFRLLHQANTLIDPK